VCLIDIRLYSLIWLTCYDISMLWIKYLDIWLILNFIKINLKFLFYKELKIDGLELKLRKNYSRFSTREETKHGSQGRRERKGRKGREEELVFGATPEIHRLHASPWNEGIVKTVPAKPKQASIEGRGKLHALFQYNGSSHMPARVIHVLDTIFPLYSI